MDRILAHLKQLKKKKILENKSILAIGRLEHISKLQDLLMSMGESLCAIIDNDRKKHGLLVNGIKVHSPEDLLVPFSDNHLILIHSPRYWREILSQFEQLGYQEDKNIIVLQKPKLSDNVRSVNFGYGIYNSLKREYGSKAVVFVCNCPLGDYYLFSLYFKRYLSVHGIDNYVIAGCSKGIDKLSHLFQIENVRQFSYEETDTLYRLYAFMGKQLDIKVLTIWQGSLSFNACMLRRCNPFSFMDTFKHFAFGLTEDTLPATPEFEGLTESSMNSFEDIGLIKDKTVILAPFSYSIQSLPISFWQKLSDSLQELGYRVAVNIDEVKEKNPVVGTITLELPLKESVCALEFAGTMIGIRSGFFDVTASAACKRIVLYPKRIEELKDYHWNREDIEFNSLKAMGLCENAIELEFPTCNGSGDPYIRQDTYDPEQSELLIRRILASCSEGK